MAFLAFLQTLVATNFFNFKLGTTVQLGKVVHFFVVVLEILASVANLRFEIPMTCRKKRI